MSKLLMKNSLTDERKVVIKFPKVRELLNK